MAATKLSLADCFADLFGLVIGMRTSVAPEAVSEFQSLFEEALDEARSQARNAGYANESIQNAEFALRAIVDDFVLKSDWSIRAEWVGSTLSRRVGVEDFGAEFFVRLQSLMGRDDDEGRAQMEVYQHCLGLGFRGDRARHVAGREELKQFNRDVARKLIGEVAIDFERLTDHHRAEASLPERVRDLPVWVVAVVAIGLILLIAALLGIAHDWRMESFGEGLGMEGEQWR